MMINLKTEVYKALKNKPDWSREGQFVFNYIEKHYGKVARDVQFIDNIDCYYNDNRIDVFIDAVSRRLDRSSKLHKVICETAYKIVKNKFDKLKYTPEFYGFKNKKEMLKLVKSDIQDACWVLTELTNWGFVEGVDFSEFFDFDKTEFVYSIDNYNFIIELEKEGELYIYKPCEVKKTEKVITVWQKL